MCHLIPIKIFYLWRTRQGSKPNLRVDVCVCGSLPLASLQERRFHT